MDSDWAIAVTQVTNRNGNKREDIGTVPLNWLSEDKTILYWPSSKKEEKNWKAKPSDGWLEYPIIKIKFTG